MSNHFRRMIALLLATAIASSATVASAMPFASGLALKDAAPATEQVRWGGHGWGWGAGAGFIAGAVIGGALAPRYYPYPYYYGPGPYYYGPGPYYAPGPVSAPGGDAVAYCMQRFKSYDPASGTYLGYDGVRHPCP
ncbi:MAG TPA: BA14K family protein [Xanthobacteraceae bacterium]|jgi:hypothetical protein|nr:BA14K family protein [Xanthobacteraceae bacterium]